MSLSLSEKLLLLRLKRKDPDAFAQFYDLYITPVYRFIYFKVPTVQDAEDLASEVFLKAWQYITDRSESVENLRPLLYKIARNLVVDFFRRRAQAEFVADQEVLVKIQGNRQQNLLAQLDTKAEIKNLEIVLRRLKDEYREAILFRYLEELSIGEIAEVLNKSKGSVRVLIHRALKVVKDIIKKEK